MAKRAVEEGGLSIRVACQAFQVSQSCYRYQAKTDAENEAIANWLLKLTDNHRNWGFGLCFLPIGPKPSTEHHPDLHQLCSGLALGMNLLKAHRKLQRMQQPMPQGTGTPA